ncbi:MAG: response regulator [Chromatiales bacterium]|nr:response regulator [Chromatiales bacterium]
MSAVVSESLSLINQELLATLGEARQILEAYIDSDGGAVDLSVCADALHSAGGALQMAEANGASLLAEEMELTCRLLIESQQSAPTDQSIEALTRAIVQLPAYIETIMVGGSDIALVLLPLLNDLRVARGRPLLSESTLLLLDTGVTREEVASLIVPAPNGQNIAALAKSLRSRFQLGLLGWIKGGSGGDELGNMQQVATSLEQAASEPDVHQLWWVVGGVIEALLEGGLDTGVAIKRLMGQVDREIKRLAAEGESAYSQKAPTELLNNLLYYVARATSQTDRVTQIREAYSLIDLIPGDEQVAQLRQMLAAPSANLIRTVADAIRQDLSNTKDVLDIFARTGMDNVAELELQVDMLRKISDTLGMLGLGSLRESVLGHSNELREIVQSGVAPDEARLVDLAASLLSAEDALDAELIALVEPAPQMEEAEPDADLNSDFHRVTQAVMRECLVNLTRIKDAMSGVMGQTEDRADLVELDILLSGINSGLSILGKERALITLDKAGVHILGFVRNGSDHLPLENLNRLADAIVSLEYYMETIQNGRSEPLYMLDNADRCLDTMAEASLTVAPPEIDVPHDATVNIEVADMALADSNEALLVDPPPEEQTPIRQTLSAERTEVLDAPQLAVLRAGEGAPDPELLEIFIAEAKECAETIRREFPIWEADTSAAKALVTVRRSYHTLKGSGRMVGAELIGEYSWSIENLLNRIINNTLASEPEVIELLRHAVAATPELIEQLEVGSPPSTNISILIANAQGYVDHGLSYQPIPLVETESEVDDLLSPDEAEQAANLVPSMDPVLLDILRKESTTHLATLRSYVADCRRSAPPFTVNKELYRAAHTLQGSLMMAEAVPAIPVAEALNQLVQHAEENRSMLATDALDAMADAADALDRIVAALDSNESSVGVDAEPIVERLQVIHAALPSLTDASAQVSDDIDGELSAGGDESAVAGSEFADIDVPAIEFDPEIAAIFAEEAAEILDSSDSSLDRLSNDVADPAAIAELQRDLHTLKGGARMAGITSMGDFSHEIEEFIGRCVEGSRPMTAEAISLLQRSFDDLHRMREQVSVGKLVPPDAVLAEELQLSIRSEASAESADDGKAPSDEMLVPGDALIPAAPDPKPEKPAAQSLISNINDKLGALARDFKSPVVPDNADIVTTLGIAAMPSLEDLVPTAESEDPDAELETAEAPESEFSEPEVPDLVASEPKPFEPEITPSAVVEEPARESAAASSREFIRVESGALEEMLNSAGEISIFHSRLNQQLGSIQFNLEELGSTVTRLREQLRAMDIETEAQILNRYKQEADNEQFDPLEMDRFSTIQQLSRALAESSSDVSSIKDLLQNLSRETEMLLGQEARTVAELQDNLMRTRMVPFQQHVPRFSRLVRQTANEERKKVNFIVEGSNGELDRQVLEKMLPPFEHMLRNAVVHGIESPEERHRLNKDETGIVKIRLRREGSEVLIEVSDDGAGLNVDEIRNQASRKIDLSDTQVVSDEAAMRLILKAGVTTAKQLTQYAGRGVGMDVVVNEVAKLGGTLGINSEPGEGCKFIIRLPYTLAVAQALIVQVANETYALPMPSIEGVIRVSHDEFDGYLEKTVPVIEYGGVVYTFRHLGQYLGLTDLGMPLDTESVSLILVKTEDEAVALITDKAVDSREIVVKALGAQLATVRGVSGATILGDGRIVIILDVTVLVRSMPMSEDSTPLVGDITSHRAPLAMVVDDSITMRRVSQRLLERRGLRVVTANDGVDALEKMEDEIPDIVLLDIEMPRMDGYEFAKNLRNNPDTRKVPIIMITSRSGEKHRARAIELGVNDYLGKPYQEQEMLESVRILLADKAPATL